jgi:probable selenium-dependent hydroxylase accessory protein YqeC
MPKAHRRKQITYYQRQRRDKEQETGALRHALVIAVAGAGGKSTYIRQQAERQAREGKRVAVTTTTHIYNPCVQYGIRESWSGDETEPVAVIRGVAYFGRPQGMGGRPDESVRSGLPESKKPDALEPCVTSETVRRDTLVRSGKPEKAQQDTLMRRGVSEDMQQSWKLGPVSQDAFRQICSRYDVVYVEADGSRSMPVKIPLEGEPVLPQGTDEVVIVMGRHAVGRPPRAVCQHYDADRFEAAVRSADDSTASDRHMAAGINTASDRHTPAGSSEAFDRHMAADSIKAAGGITALENQEPQMPLTEAQLRHLAEVCYIRPLRIRYPWIRSTYFLSDMYRLGEKEHVSDVTFILMASGFGRRYSGSENKLLADVHGRPLYLHALEHLAKSARQLRSYKVHVRTGVVTRYPEIMQQTADMQDPDITYLENHMAEEGITSSIRIGTKKATADHAQLVVFFAADMPYLDAGLITRFVCDCICSGKPYGCMAVRNEAERTVTPTVPGAFRLDKEQVADRLLALHGDRGAMRLIRQRPWDTYYFYTEPSSIRDIDQKEDNR